VDSDTYNDLLKIHYSDALRYAIEPAYPQLWGAIDYTPKENTMSMTTDLKLKLMNKAIRIVENETTTYLNTPKKRKQVSFTFKRVMKVYNQLKAESA